ncbi:Carboxylesterase NlhH [Anatilimnocola aggregata]|uniref:Carboxylesterase NlhH n=1 Tax=Anatilimnocola aggregata TaxID=2528021 RepID=A0A517YHE5_9BACT|nr:alpha/beta hydrolase [Anatilimnocola aggregata]QDU29646.1 Carboxylesterase NlhH [Anatilimnocola aggregata]
MPRPIRLHVLLILSLCAFVGQSLTLSAADEIRVLKDMPYKAEATTEYEQQRCKLDLYLPANAKNFPTIVWFHGGGLQAGSNDGDGALGRRFANDGIAVASVNYRLDPNVKFPAYIEDAAAAFSFVRKQITEYGGSPDSIFVSGHSAGGYLTAMIGADEKYLAKHNLKLQDIAGLMPISGQMITHSTVRAERGIPKTRPVIDQAAPAYYSSRETPAWLLIVGSQDMASRAEENRYFGAALKAAGHKDVTYLEVEGRNHGTIGNRIGEPTDTVALAMLEFMKRLRRPASP